MEFKLLNESSLDQYEQFVAANDGSFLQSWSWGKFQTKPRQKVFRFALADSGLKLTAQFIEQTIPHLGGRYLYSPYGPVGDSSLVPELIAQIQKLYPEYWFVRTEPQKAYEQIGKPTLRIQPGKTLIMDLTATEDELLSGMHHKTRYNIKIAQKHGVSIARLSTAEKISEALELISQTSARQGFTDHPARYYQTLVSSLPNVSVYAASYRDSILSCAIMIDYNETRTYLFGGSSSEHRNVMAPYLLHWQAMLDAKTQNKKHYDWWGIETASGKTPGFTRFKLGWPGQQVSYPAPADAVNKPINYLAYKLLRSLNRLF